MNRLVVTVFQDGNVLYQRFVSGKPSKTWESKDPKRLVSELRAHAATGWAISILAR